MSWKLLLDLGSTLVATHLAGYQFASDRLAMHNALLLNDRNTAVRHWFRAWDFGRRYGPASVMSPAFGFALSAYIGGFESTSFYFETMASVFLISVTAYTVFIVFPMNDDLLAEHARITAEEKKNPSCIETPSPETVRNRMADWKRADATRLVLMWASVLTGAIAMYKSGASGKPQ